MITLVLDRGNRVGAADADGEAVGSIISFGPPAVENREVERAVEHGLLPRSAAGLLGTPRVVQPDVDPLHQGPGHVHVVIFHEDDAIEKPVLAGDPHDALDQLLAHPVLGWALPAKMIWMGRSVALTRSVSRSTSWRIRPARL